MRKIFIRTALGLVLVLVAAIAWMSYRMGGVDQLYGLVRYGYLQVEQGELEVGDPAPDVELVALDGKSRFRLRERLGARPLVLIFGSYT